MKDLNLMIWLTQLGLSVAVPLAGFVLLAVWLRDSCGWGEWVIWVGAVLGMITAMDALRNGLKFLDRVDQNKKDPRPPAVTFNDHD